MNAGGRKDAIRRRKRRVVLGPVMAVLVVALLAFGSWRLARLYATDAIEIDRSVMNRLSIDGSQRAEAVRSFFDGRASELNELITHIERDPELTNADAAATKALELAHKLRDATTNSGEVTAFGIRDDCVGHSPELINDKDHGRCKLRYYRSVAVWYLDDLKKWRKAALEGQAATNAPKPPWVLRVAEKPGDLFISRLDGEWVSQGATKLATFKSSAEYQPAYLYNGVFHLARAIHKFDREIVVVVDVDQAHLAEVAKKEVLPHENAISSPASSRTAKDWYDDYKKARYAYIVDDRTWMIAHPKPWHIVGVRPNEQTEIDSITQKDREGTKPLNIRAYLDEHPEKTQHSDDMTRYYKMVVEATDKAQIAYGTGNNLEQHERVAWVQPIILKSYFRWLPLNGSDTKDEFDRVFGSVIVGDDVTALLPKWQAILYFGPGFVVAALLAISLFIGIRALAEIDELRPEQYSDKRWYFIPLAAGIRILQKVRELGDRRDAQARSFYENIFRQLLRPFNVLDTDLAALSHENAPPERLKELLPDLNLSIQQLRVIHNQYVYARESSEDVQLEERLRSLITQQRWDVDFSADGHNVCCYVPPRVIDDSVIELVKNARIAIEQTGKAESNSIRIELSTTPDGYAIIAVRDDGIGLHHEISKKAESSDFPFTWGQSYWKLKSRGLSLPCMRLRLAMFGGEVTVVSDGSGSVTTAKISLPLKKRSVAGVSS